VPRIIALSWLRLVGQLESSAMKFFCRCRGWIMGSGDHDSAGPSHMDFVGGRQREWASADSKTSISHAESRGQGVSSMSPESLVSLL
jgi:hypothetical protein